jgi:Uma2 family endonuclease
MTATAPQKITAEVYLAQEAAAPHKSEYHGGEIVAMAGAGLKHNQIVSNLIFLLNRCLWEKDCQVFPSDMLLKLPECARYVYPDVMLACGALEMENHKGLEVLLNPKVVIEVLSESTAARDQTEKRDCYLTLKSLQQYITIDSRSVQVSIFNKKDEGEWLFSLHNDRAETLKIGDCAVLLEEVYKKITF